MGVGAEILSWWRKKARMERSQQGGVGKKFTEEGKGWKQPPQEQGHEKKNSSASLRKVRGQGKESAVVWLLHEF